MSIFEMRRFTIPKDKKGIDGKRGTFQTLYIYDMAKGDGELYRKGPFLLGISGPTSNQYYSTFLDFLVNG